MKKLFKQISKTFLIAIMAIVTTLTFVGCGNTTSSKNSNINASEITDTNTGNEDKDKADNVSDSDDKKDQEVSEKIELYGIYKYTRELNFDDCDRSNSEEVIKYFKTRDFNGVYNAIKPLGFDAYKSPQITQEYGITSFPTFILFKHGDIQTQFAGFRTKSELLDTVLRYV